MVGTRWNPASAGKIAPAVEVSPGFEGEFACHPGGFEDHGRSGNHIIFHNIWYRTQTEDDFLPIITCILVDVPILYYIDIGSKREYMYVDIICNMYKTLQFCIGSVTFGFEMCFFSF